jgi:hypothetical protein
LVTGKSQPTGQGNFFSLSGNGIDVMGDCLHYNTSRVRAGSVLTQHCKLQEVVVCCTAMAEIVSTEMIADKEGDASQSVVCFTDTTATNFLAKQPHW